mgnify:CR=1 FL=1
MELYVNEATGTELRVREAGRSFKSLEIAPATQYSREYRKERKHRTYDSVLALVTRRSLHKADY